MHQYIGAPNHPAWIGNARRLGKNARNLSRAISHYIGLANSCFPVISAFLSFLLSGHISSLILPPFRSFQLSDPSYFPVVPRVRWKEDQSATGLLLRTQSAGPVSQTCLLRLLRWELLRAVTLDDSTPQHRISELRVWSYEPFIVFAPSSSGYTSGQNLEVLYIIRNIIWNIIK
jgi:hypothetical protein